MFLFLDDETCHSILDIIHFLFRQSESIPRLVSDRTITTLFRHHVETESEAHSTASPVDYGDEVAGYWICHSALSVVRLCAASPLGLLRTSIYWCLWDYWHGKSTTLVFIQVTTCWSWAQECTSSLFGLSWHTWCWCIQLTPTHYLCVVIYYDFPEVWLQNYYAPCYSGIDNVHTTHNGFYLISSLLLVAQEIYYIFHKWL